MTKYYIQCLYAEAWVSCNKSYKTFKTAKKNLDRISHGRVLGATRLVKTVTTIIDVV